MVRLHRFSGTSGFLLCAMYLRKNNIDLITTCLNKSNLHLTNSMNLSAEFLTLTRFYFLQFAMRPVSFLHPRIIHARIGRRDSTSSILILHVGHSSVLSGAHKLSEEHIGATGHPHYYLNTKVRTLGKLKYGRFFFAGMLIFDRKLKNR